MYNLNPTKIFLCTHLTNSLCYIWLKFRQLDSGVGIKRVRPDTIFILGRFLMNVQNTSMFLDYVAENLRVKSVKRKYFLHTQ
jgi:hypothetical protein